MSEQHQQMLSEILEIHDALHKRLGTVSLERLAQLSAAVVVASSLQRAAEAIEGQGKSS